MQSIIVPVRIGDMSSFQYYSSIIDRRDEPVV